MPKILPDFDNCDHGGRCPGSLDKLEMRKDDTEDIIRRRYSMWQGVLVTSTVPPRFFSCRRFTSKRFPRFSDPKSVETHIFAGESRLCVLCVSCEDMSGSDRTRLFEGNSHSSFKGLTALGFLLRANGLSSSSSEHGDQKVCSTIFVQRQARRPLLRDCSALGLLQDKRLALRQNEK